MIIVSYIKWVMPYIYTIYTGHRNIVGITPHIVYEPTLLQKYYRKSKINSACFQKLKTENELFMWKIANEPVATRIF